MLTDWSCTELGRVVTACGLPAFREVGCETACCRPRQAVGLDAKLVAWFAVAVKGKRRSDLGDTQIGRSGTDCMEVAVGV